MSTGAETFAGADAQTWAALVKLTRNNTLILGPPRVEETSNGIRVEAARSRVAWGVGFTVFAGIVLIPLNSLFLTEVWRGSPMPIPWWIVMIFLGALDLVVLLATGRMIMHRATLELDTALSRITISKGSLFRRTHELTLDGLRVERGRREHGRPPVVWPEGESLVSLRYERFPDPVHIAGGEATAVEALYAELARWLPTGERIERFTAPIELPRGGVIHVSTLRMGEMSSTMRSHSCHIDPPFVARVPPSASMRLFLAAFLVVGLMALALAPDAGKGSLMGGLIVSLVGTVFAGVGLIGVAGGLPQTVIDLRDDVFEHRVLWRPRFHGRASDIAALQLCAGWHEDSESSPYYVYELNAVLSEPAGRRFTLMVAGDDTKLREEAARLAQFLGVDVVDHSAT